MFRTDTLAKLDPVDKKKQAATNAAMDELLDTAVGLNSFVIPDMPISNTRAALYIYLNASVRYKEAFTTCIYIHVYVYVVSFTGQMLILHVACRTPFG